MSPERSWKVAERRLARDVGCERIPVTGERHGADFVSGLFCYQAKVRNTIPGWLFEWLAGIVATAGKDRTGVLVLNQPGKSRHEAVVCVRWADWVALHGEAGTDSEG